MKAEGIRNVDGRIVDVPIEIHSTFESNWILAKESSRSRVVVSGAIERHARPCVEFLSGEAVVGVTSVVHGVESKPGPLQTKESGTRAPPTL